MVIVNVLINNPAFWLLIGVLVHFHVRKIPRVKNLRKYIRTADFVYWPGIERHRMEYFQLLVSAICAVMLSASLGAIMDDTRFMYLENWNDILHVARALYLLCIFPGLTIPIFASLASIVQTIEYIFKIYRHIKMEDYDHESYIFEGGLIVRFLEMIPILSFIVILVSGRKL